MLFRRVEAEVADGKQAGEGDVLGGEGGGASFEAVDDRQDAGYFQAEFLNALDGFERRAAGGDDVFDNGHSVAGLNGAFDVFIGAVAFGFFTHQDAGEREVADAGERDGGRGDRIGADGHAADGLGERALLGEQIEEALADEDRAAGIEGDLLAIEVVFGFFARGEGEVAEFEGAAADEIDEGLAVVHGADGGFGAVCGETEEVIVAERCGENRGRLAEGSRWIL